MNNLAPVPPQAPPATLAQAELDAARTFAEAEKSPATRRCYARDWDIFRSWCATRRVTSLPADPGHHAAFLASQAQAGVKASSITRRVSALRYAHKLAGYTEPATNSEL